MSIPHERMPHLQSRRCRECRRSKIRQAFSRSSEPSRPSLGVDGGADLWIPFEKVADFSSWLCHDCVYRNSDRLSRDPRRHPAPRLSGRGALISRSLLKGRRISHHDDAMAAWTRKSDRLSRDPRSRPAPRVAGRRALISGSLVQGWPISNRGNAMIARTQNSSRTSRDSRSHPAHRLQGREALVCRSLVKGRRISNHRDAMTA